MLFVVVLSAVILSVIMLCVVKLSIIILNVSMLGVVILSDIDLADVLTLSLPPCLYELEVLLRQALPAERVSCQEFFSCHFRALLARVFNF
jgi:hypothetical protein